MLKIVYYFTLIVILHFWTLQLHYFLKLGCYLFFFVTLNSLVWGYTGGLINIYFFCIIKNIKQLVARNIIGGLRVNYPLIIDATKSRDSDSPLNQNTVQSYSKGRTIIRSRVQFLWLFFNFSLHQTSIFSANQGHIFFKWVVGDILFVCIFERWYSYSISSSSFVSFGQEWQVKELFLSPTCHTHFIFFSQTS